MAEFNLNKSLDPKLRRLVRSMHDPERLRSDRERAFVTADAAAPDTAPEQHLKRVLVQVDRDEEVLAAFNLKWHRLADGLYSVSVPVTQLDDLARHSHVKFVESGRRMTPALDTSVPAATVDVVHTPPAGTGLHGSGVVVGVIDMGFDFTLDDFTAPDGTTRIAFLWDQSLTPRGSESKPAEFDYGVEYTAADIDAARRSTGDPFSLVRHKPDTFAHGTHVTGIAAGNGSSADGAFPGGKYIGVADAATLILVQPGIEDTANTLADSAHVADAVDYIFRRAGQLNMPCVINLSLGQNGGSHDGDSVVERAIDRLLDKTGRALVVAAGNEHIWRTHASGVLKTTAPTQSLKWRIGIPPKGFPPTTGAADGTPNELEIWYSSRDAFAVRVFDPTGNVTSPLAPDNSDKFTLAGGDVYVDSERFTALNGDARIYIEISSKTAIQSGTWLVEISAVELRAGRFDAWIERDQRNALNGFADQSSFDDGDFDASMTLGTPATARRAIAVANYNHRLTEISDSSGRGPTRDRREKPECSAPGTAILSACALGARSQNGSVAPVRIAMSGTSMAAPHVTGVLALLFERALALKFPALSAEQARKLIIAATSPAPGIAGYDPAWGFGLLDAEAAVRLLEQ